MERDLKKNSENNEAVKDKVPQEDDKIVCTDNDDLTAAMQNPEAILKDLEAVTETWINKTEASERKIVDLNDKASGKNVASASIKITATVVTVRKENSKLPLAQHENAYVCKVECGTFEKTVMENPETEEPVRTGKAARKAAARKRVAEMKKAAASDPTVAMAIKAAKKLDAARKRAAAERKQEAAKKKAAAERKAKLKAENLEATISLEVPVATKRNFAAKKRAAEGKALVRNEAQVSGETANKGAATLEECKGTLENAPGKNMTAVTKDSTVTELVVPIQNIAIRQDKAAPRKRKTRTKKEQILHAELHEALKEVNYQKVISVLERDLVKLCKNNFEKDGCYALAISTNDYKIKSAILKYDRGGKDVTGFDVLRSCWNSLEPLDSIFMEIAGKTQRLIKMKNGRVDFANNKDQFLK